MRPGTPQYRHWQGIGYVKRQEAKRRAMNSRFQGNYTSPRKSGIGTAAVGAGIGGVFGGPVGVAIGGAVGWLFGKLR